MHSLLVSSHISIYYFNVGYNGLSFYMAAYYNDHFIHYNQRIHSLAYGYVILTCELFNKRQCLVNNIIIDIY